MALRTKTTWRAKLEKDQERKLVDVEPGSKCALRMGSGRMLIPRPLDVDAVVRTIRKGKLMTQPRLREALARQFKADFTCPITSGIFLRIAAEAAEEDRAAGKKAVAPYWRVLRPDGSINEKFPGGVEYQVSLLKGEGFKLVPGKGKKMPRVVDFEKYVQGAKAG